MFLFFKRATLLFLLITFIFSQQADSAKATISPNEVIAGTTAKEFNYKISFFGGTADSIVITNPFKDYSIIVSSIKIKGESILLSNQVSRPNASGYASWHYDDSEKNLIISTDTSAISDSIEIYF